MKHLYWLVTLSALSVTVVGCSDQQSDAVSETADAGNAEVATPESAPAKATEDTASADAGPGIAIGAQAPDFELKDQTGTSRSLSALLKNGPVALVFYRSADW